MQFKLAVGGERATNSSNDSFFTTSFLLFLTPKKLQQVSSASLLCVVLLRDAQSKRLNESCDFTFSPTSCPSVCAPAAPLAILVVSARVRLVLAIVPCPPVRALLLSLRPYLAARPLGHTEVLEVPTLSLF